MRPIIKNVKEFDIDLLWADVFNFRLPDDENSPSIPMDFITRE